jgi:hypothetical protein
VICSTALDISDAATAFLADGNDVDHDDLASITPYITHTIRRLGGLVLDLNPPNATPTTRLDLEPASCSRRTSRRVISRSRVHPVRLAGETTETAVSRTVGTNWWFRRPLGEGRFALRRAPRRRR